MRSISVEQTNAPWRDVDPRGAGCRNNVTCVVRSARWCHQVIVAMRLLPPRSIPPISMEVSGSAVTTTSGSIPRYVPILRCAAPDRGPRLCRRPVRVEICGAVLPGIAALLQRANRVAEDPSPNPVVAHAAPPGAGRRTCDLDLHRTTLDDDIVPVNRETASPIALRQRASKTLAVRRRARTTPASPRVCPVHGTAGHKAAGSEAASHPAV